MSRLRFVLPLLVLVAAAGYLTATPHPGAAGADCVITVDTSMEGVTPDGFVTLREAVGFANGDFDPTIGEIGNVVGCANPGGGTDDRIGFDPAVFDVFPPPVISITTAIEMHSFGDVIEGTFGEGIWVDGGGLNIDCLRIYNGSGNAIGGMVVRNCLRGIHITSVSPSRAGFGNAGSPIVAEDNLLIGNVVGSNGTGIQITGAGASDNSLYMNMVGLTANDLVNPDPNGTGVRVLDAPNNVIGGPIPFRAREVAPAGSVIVTSNVISGNTNQGIQVDGPSANRNVIQGNAIGTLSGGEAKPNGTYGIEISKASDTQIGGTELQEPNIISGNTLAGITILAAAATNNVIEGNFIGTDGSGEIAIPNGTNGIEIFASSGNRIGGSDAAARNVISGNAGVGVSLSEGAFDNVIEGNHIGTDGDGAQAIPNGQGYYSDASPDNQILRNVISGNNGPGIAMFSPGNSGNVIYGNHIGVGANGDLALGNGLQGVFIAGTGPNVIGGTGQDQGNIIANNGEAGVDIRLLPVISHMKTVRGNSIHSNGGLGIDLEGDGVTENDPLDADDGGNALQNFPELTAATDGPDDVTVTGSLDSMPSTAFTLDFYANQECDPSGNGEGEMPLQGQFAVITGADGHIDFQLEPAGIVSLGDVITATATDADGNTSEFSECIEVAQAKATPTPEPTATPGPTPTAMPTPGPSETPSEKGPLGDTDCDIDIDSVDSLWVLREVASLPFDAKCIDQGDVQCDGDRDSVDALGIQRHVAALPPLAQEPGCRPIGT